MSIYFDSEKGRFRWQFKATIGERRHRLSRLLPSGWSEAQARRFDQQETARAYARLSAGRPVAPSVAEAVDAYLRERVPSLADAKNTALNLAHLLPWIDGRSLEELGAISKEYAAQNTDLAPATVRQRLATLRAAANYGLKHHRLGTKDWIAQMVMPAVSNARTRHIERADVLRIARQCRHPIARAWILLTFATGSRPGELAKAEARGDHFAKRLKNGDYALLPVPERYRRYMRHWPIDYDYSTISRHFRRAVRDAGIEDFRPHDLRHSTASALIALGASMPQVGEVLNHKSLQATKRYAHLDTSRKLAALDLIFERRKAGAR